VLLGRSCLPVGGRRGSRGRSWKGAEGASGQGGARGGGALTEWGPKESGTDTCAAGKKTTAPRSLWPFLTTDNGSASLGSTASRGRMGTSASV
jgi:hypothetical protein